MNHGVTVGHGWELVHDCFDAFNGVWLHGGVGEGLYLAVHRRVHYEGVHNES